MALRKPYELSDSSSCILEQLKLIITKMYEVLLQDCGYRNEIEIPSEGIECVERR